MESPSQPTETQQSGEAKKPHHFIPHSMAELKETIADHAIDKVKDTLEETFLTKPTLTALKGAGESLLEQAPEIAANQGPLAGAIAKGAGRAAVELTDVVELGTNAAKIALRAGGQALMDRAPFLSASQGSLVGDAANGLGRAAVNLSNASEIAANALKTAGQALIDRAPGLAASHGDLVSNVAKNAGRAAVAASEGAEGSAALATAGATTATMAGLAAEGYAVYKVTTAIDEHTNHAITNSAPAKEWGTLQERVGADERLWYAQQAKDSFDAKHHGETGFGTEVASGIAWTKALVDPHMLDNHAQSLQSTINTTLTLANKAHAAISLDEAHVILSAITDAKPGDRILIDQKGNVELATGMAGHPVEKGTTSFDASVLRMAATQRYEAPGPTSARTTLAQNDGSVRER
jgi:hypothetical protein